MGRVATVEPGSIHQCGVAVFEEPFAFLRQMPLGAQTANPTRIHQTPRHPMPDPRGVAIGTDRDHTPNRFMPENGRCGPVASATQGVKVGSANGGEVDGDEHFADTGIR